VIQDRRVAPHHALIACLALAGEMENVTFPMIHVAVLLSGLRVREDHHVG
jgi:hypothetical protein